MSVNKMTVGGSSPGCVDMLNLLQCGKTRSSNNQVFAQKACFRTGIPVGYLIPESSYRRATQLGDGIVTSFPLSILI